MQCSCLVFFSLILLYSSFGTHDSVTSLGVLFFLKPAARTLPHACINIARWLPITHAPPPCNWLPGHRRLPWSSSYAHSLNLLCSYGPCMFSCQQQKLGFLFNTVHIYIHKLVICHIQSTVLNVSLNYSLILCMWCSINKLMKLC